MLPNIDWAFKKVFEYIVEQLNDVIALDIGKFTNIS